MQQDLCQTSAKWMVLLPQDRKSTRLNSSHVSNSYAVFCLKKKVITVARDKAVHFTVDNILDITVASECLAHARGIDVHLNIRLTSCEDITLKIRRNIYREGIAPGVQPGIHLIGGDHLRGQKPRAVEAVNDPVR